MLDQLERYRAGAAERVEVFRSRYHEGGNRDCFVAIAERWSSALNRHDLDANELSNVIRDAEQYRFGG